MAKLVKKDGFRKFLRQKDRSLAYTNHGGNTTAGLHYGNLARAY